jgi:Cu+-exporting ATPase
MAEKQELTIDGMTCSNCALSVQKTIEKKGGKSVAVSFATKKASFESDTEAIDDISKAIENIGYTVVSKNQPKQKGWSKMEKLFTFCLVFTLPLFFHMFVGHEHWLNNPILQICLVLPVLFTGGLHFVKSAWHSIKGGVPNMDVLIAVGILSSFAYSLWGVLMHYGEPELHNFMFFETAASITSLVLLGNLIEERSVQKTTTAIEDLKKLQPEKVLKKEGDDFVEVDISSIVVGDVFRVVEGDRIPLDGKIIDGKIEVDESMLSGESEPLYKTTEQHTLGGTIVIGGNALIESTKAIGNSALDHIISLVSNAQERKPNIQKIGDRISAIFVPVVLGISAITFVVSVLFFDISFQNALMRSIAVLVISCPCAMGLAAPTAIMVGIGRAAKEGVLVKGGDTLEKLSKCNVAIFDKTGTLTTGNFTLQKLNIIEGDEQEIKSVILSLEKISKHPIAKSLSNILSEEVEETKLKEVEEIKGEGIQGKDEKENQYQLFSAKKAGQILNKEIDADIVLLKNNTAIAELWIADEVKADAKQTIEWLKSQNITPILLSGDKEKKCKIIADELGISEYYSEHTPNQKLEKLDKIHENRFGMMVGDGINDAPALARSYVGISFGEATDIAMNAADVVLSNQKLTSLTNAIHIGRLTYQTVKQNFFWALFYNVLAIPVAAFGGLVPIYAALSMAFSDVIVIGNSIRLKVRK